MYTIFGDEIDLGHSGWPSAGLYGVVQSATGWLWYREDKEKKMMAVLVARIIQCWKLTKLYQIKETKLCPLSDQKILIKLIHNRIFMI